MTDEAEPFLGSGRFGTECLLQNTHQDLFLSRSLQNKCLLLLLFYWIYFSFVLQQIYLFFLRGFFFYFWLARAYLLGYNCADEKELEATLRFCWIVFSYAKCFFYLLWVLGTNILSIAGSCCISSINKNVLYSPQIN